MDEPHDGDEYELINDIYQHSFTFRFGKGAPIIVDPNRWDGQAEALVSDVRAKERRLIGKARLGLAELALAEQQHYDALDQPLRDVLGGVGNFYDEAVADAREQIQHDLTAALTTLIVDLLLPYLAPDNPALTPDDLRRLRADDRVKLLSFFERPASALARHQAQRAPSPPAVPATPATTPASPASSAATAVPTTAAA